jgi:hypothetical protein
MTVSGLCRALCVVILATGTLGAGSAGAAEIGANDDHPKFVADAGDAFYASMAETGLRQIVLTMRWRPTAPLEIAGKDDLDRAVSAAAAHGLRVVFAAYPYPATETATPAGFAAWLTLLATTYPTVTHYVVLNEPNQPAFFRPQFDASGRNVSAARAGALLAAGYDALKAVDPTITVLGVGLSPRGNDRPNAKNNISTSPMRFLAALGAWYRASGRTLPLMDEFSFHPYPNSATDPLDRGYPWPAAGFVNLDRLQQGLWDAFNGTPQPTTVDGLKISLDEVGWQVDTSPLAGYLGTENVAVTTEAKQAAIYGELVRRALCDPVIGQVNLFGFYDDSSRTGFQAGLNHVDGTPRPSRTAVADALTAPPCPTPTPSFVPLTGVGKMQQPVLEETSPTETVVTVSAAEGGRVIACVLAGRVSVASVRRRLRSDTPPDGCAVIAMPANRLLPVTLVHPSSGRYTIALRVEAETNPRRANAFSYPRP